MRLEQRYLTQGNQVGDMGRDMIYQGWNSDTESVEDSVSDVMGMGESGSRVGLKVWS